MDEEMRVQIVSIADRGQAHKERLHLRPIVNLNLAYVVVLNSRYLGPAAVAANALPAFWFPPQEVTIGDNIVLFSGPGKASSRKNPDGTTDYFHYWGYKQTIWHDPASCVVVVDVNSWQTSYSVGTPTNVPTTSTPTK